MKKFATLLMALSLTLCLAACGGGTPAPQTDAAESNAAEESAQVTDDAQAPDESAEAADDAQAAEDADAQAVEETPADAQAPEESAEAADDAQSAESADDAQAPEESAETVDDAQAADEPEEFLWKGYRIYVTSMQEDLNPADSIGYEFAGKQVQICLTPKEELINSSDVDFSDGETNKDFQLKGPDGTLYSILAVSYNLSNLNADWRHEDVQYAGVSPIFDVPAETPLSDFTLVIQSDEGERQISLANVTVKE